MQSAVGQCGESHWEHELQECRQEHAGRRVASGADVDGNASDPAAFWSLLGAPARSK